MSDRVSLTRRRVLRGMLAASGLALLSFSRSAKAAVKTGDRPRTIAAADLDGNFIAVPDAFVGRVLAVHFWASWCPPCLREIEALGSLVEQYRASGFMAVSLHVGGTKALASEFLRDRKIPYPVLLDTESAAARLYGVGGIPTTFLLDRRGVVRFKILGEIDRDGLQRMLMGML